MANAKEKFEVEDEVRKDVVHGELLTMRPQIRALHPRMAEDLKSAFDDGRVRDTIAQAEVPDLWMKHVQLSVNLEMLRNSWRNVKKKTGQMALKNKGLNELAMRQVFCESLYPRFVQSLSRSHDDIVTFIVDKT